MERLCPNVLKCLGLIGTPAFQGALRSVSETSALRVLKIMIWNSVLYTVYHCFIFLFEGKKPPHTLVLLYNI